MTKVDRPADASEFGYLLAVAARRWRRALDEALAGFGLSDASWRPLVHLDRLGEGARQNDLARSLGIEGPSLVRLLDRLATAGLIERREDSSDRRAKTIHFTAEGRALVARLRAVVDGVCSTLVAEIDRRDVAASMRALEGVLARTESEAPGGPDA